MTLQDVKKQTIDILSLKDTTANPAPLGLLGFGMTTVLLNIHNAGYYELNTMILAMGIFYGGLAQIIAGIMEWKKNNTFGTTAFTSYGLFWLTLVGLILMPKLGLGEATSKPAFAAYFFMWGLFTFVMFIGTLRLNRALQFVFLSLTVLFFLLAIRDYPAALRSAHWQAMRASSAVSLPIYTALAQVLNEVYKKVVAPLGPM